MQDWSIIARMLNGAGSRRRAQTASAPPAPTQPPPPRRVPELVQPQQRLNAGVEEGAGTAAGRQEEGAGTVAGRQGAELGEGGANVGGGAGGAVGERDRGEVGRDGRRMAADAVSREEGAGSGSEGANDEGANADAHDLLPVDAVVEGDEAGSQGRGQIGEEQGVNENEGRHVQPSGCTAIWANFVGVIFPELLIVLLCALLYLRNLLWAAAAALLSDENFWSGVGRVLPPPFAFMMLGAGVYVWGAVTCGLGESC